MKKYHIELLKTNSKLPSVMIGVLKDDEGKYYNNYKEDSYICDEKYISPTIKSKIKSFWVLVNGKNK